MQGLMDLFPSKCLSVTKPVFAQEDKVLSGDNNDCCYVELEGRFQAVTCVPLENLSVFKKNNAVMNKLGVIWKANNN